MPQFRDVPQRDLRALASFVAGLGSVEPLSVDEQLLAPDARVLYPLRGLSRLRRGR
jgi:hypothetical protein